MLPVRTSRFGTHFFSTTANVKSSRRISNNAVSLEDDYSIDKWCILISLRWILVVKTFQNWQNFSNIIFYHFWSLCNVWNYIFHQGSNRKLSTCRNVFELKSPIFCKIKTIFMKVWKCRKMQALFLICRVSNSWFSKVLRRYNTAYCCASVKNSYHKLIVIDNIKLKNQTTEVGYASGLYFLQKCFWRYLIPFFSTSNSFGTRNL